LGYDDLLPYLKRLEDNERGGDQWRGSGGPQSVSERRIHHPLDEIFVAAARELGIAFNPDLNGASAEGVGYVQAAQKRGVRASTASAYITPIRHRRNLEVRLLSPVNRVLIEGGRAVGVEVRSAGGLRTERARHGVIISAGALATPGLLMRSGIGPGARLAELGIPVVFDSPGVGKNLQEHAGVRLSFHTRMPTLSSDTGPIRSALHLFNYLLNRRGPLAMCIGHAQAFVRTRPELPVPNVQIILSPLAIDFTDKGPRPYPKPAATFAIGLNRSHGSGTIDIASADPVARPIIRHELLSHPLDVEYLIEACRLGRRLLATQAFAPHVIDERLPGAQVQTDAQLEQYLRGNAFLMYHPCGTARMGVDALAVVDPQLRVRGLAGLWVADASVMPTVTAGNINATCIAIGEKASDLVLAARRESAS